jgi:hypothetical protein
MLNWVQSTGPRPSAPTPPAGGFSSSGRSGVPFSGVVVLEQEDRICAVGIGMLLDDDR